MFQVKYMIKCSAGFDRMYSSVDTQKHFKVFSFP